MATLDDVLRDGTNKGQADDTARRVFFTFTARECLDEAQRNTKLISSLVALLGRKGILSGVEVDDLLLGCIG